MQTWKFIEKGELKQANSTEMTAKTKKPSGHDLDG